MTPLVSHHITVRLGGRAVVDELFAQLHPGEVTVVAGPNGGGKSTWLNCLAGLRKPDGGEVRLDAIPVLRLKPPERAQRIAVLPQTPEIAWDVEVETLVGLGRLPFEGGFGPGAEDRAATMAALSATGLAEFAHRRAQSLSGGERARALIARAIAGRPQWLLADEPLDGLDPAHAIDALMLLRRIAAQGVGVVVTLHDLNVAARLADRILLLKAGRLAADGAPKAALTAESLAEVYGVRAAVSEGEAGLRIEAIGRL
jgi:iron complex transport system ATP-binding protein